MPLHHKGLGFSVYLSNYGEVYPHLKANPVPGASVFTSFHIAEEFSHDYAEAMKGLVRSLSDLGYQVIGDVSKKTAQQFQQEDFYAFAKELGLHALRLDYGFTDDEMIDLSKKLPIALNASTIDLPLAQRIRRGGGQVIAFHNFYPRPETGLDGAFFQRGTAQLQALQLPVYAFIPGDVHLRGPIYQGLPTLEHHRGVKPLAAYCDLLTHYGADVAFVGDGILSQTELGYLQRYWETGVIPVPANLEKTYHWLYNQIYTSRPDSPAGLIRLQESRENGVLNKEIVPQPATQRACGVITIDNRDYGRYCGEIQLLRQDYPPDPRVNVIGAVSPGYELLPACIPNGGKFMFVEGSL